MPDIPVDQLTNRQYLHLIYEGITAMAQEIEDLKAEVAAESEEDVLTAQTIADQQARIAELEAAVAAAQEAADNAAAGQAGAEQALTDALAEVATQVAALKADNPAPEPDPNA